MTDCIFCKIINGEIPSSPVYEDDHTIAFLDISPVNPGHTLVVPKRHCVNLEDMREEEIYHVFGIAKKLAPAIAAGVQADGFNIGMNNGKVAGQVVMHAHVHIMPRFSNDGLELWRGRSYETGQKEEVAKRIVMRLDKQ